jgi:hypothetical protein
MAEKKERNLKEEFISVDVRNKISTNVISLSFPDSKFLLQLEARGILSDSRKRCLNLQMDGNKDRSGVKVLIVSSISEGMEGERDRERDP